MRSLYSPFILLALLCLFGHTAHANHHVGGELTWSHASGDYYKVNLTAYLDCNGLPYGNSVTISGSNLCGTSTFTASLSRTSITDITPVCHGSCTRCSDLGCADTYFGLNRYEYSGLIQMDKLLCCKWLLSFTGEQYHETWMDLCSAGGNNSSPYFTKDARIVFCKDQCIVYNPGARDDDTVGGGDILTYSFVPAKRNASSLYQYATGNAYDHPVMFQGHPNTNSSWSSSCSGFHIDTATGEMKFKPTKSNEISQLAFMVEEWRRDGNGVLQKIGAVTRNLRIAIADCSSSTLPNITSPDNKTAYIFCAGVEGAIPIETSDQSTDSVKLTWNEQVDDAAFTVNNFRVQSGNLKWTPSVADIRDRPYQFVVTATDNACPLPAARDLTYTIKVVGEVKPVHFTSDSIGLRSFQFNPDTTDSTLQFHWSFGNGDTSNQANPQYTYNKDGAYTVKLITKYPSLWPRSQ